MARPKKTKTADWKRLVTLARKYDKAGNPLPGPAVQVTYARKDDTVFFSHTPGIIVDGAFRAVQHIHDRHADVYVFLIVDAMMAVSVTKKAGIETVEADLELFRMTMRDAQQVVRTIDKLDREAHAVLSQARPGGHPAPRKMESGKSPLRATLGDILRAKESS